MVIRTGEIKEATVLNHGIKDENDGATHYRNMNKHRTKMKPNQLRVKAIIRIQSKSMYTNRP